MVERWEIEEKEGSVESRYYRNSFQIYTFLAPSIEVAITKLAYVTHRLKEFPVWIEGRKDVSEKIIGRLVYYRERPAFVVSFNAETGQVLLRAEEKEGFTQEPWVEESTADHNVFEDLLSPHIFWNRRETSDAV